VALWIVMALAAASVVLLLVLLLRRPPAQDNGRLELLAANERIERELRREISDSSRGLRGELTQTLSAFQQALLQQAQESTRTNNAQIDAFAQQLTMLQKNLSDTLVTQLQALSDANARRIAEVRATL
jgi:DNA recombination protein RmuC